LLLLHIVCSVVNINDKSQFCCLRSIYQNVQGTKCIIIVQYSLTRTSGDLIPCAQHICKEIASQYENCENVKIVFLLQLNRGAKRLVSYQSTWQCVHIDEIRRSDKPTLIEYIEQPISTLFDNSNEWLHLIKRTIQAAVEIVNKKSTMEASMITRKISVLDKMLSTTNQGTQYIVFHFFGIVFCLLLFDNI